MKTIECNELPDDSKKVYYECFFGERSTAYTPTQRKEIVSQILTMIAGEGIEVAVGRVIGLMYEETPDAPQLVFDSFYNAVLWLHRLHSTSN